MSDADPTAPDWDADYPSDANLAATPGVSRRNRRFPSLVEVLHLCCDVDSKRYDFGGPRLSEGWTVATNGRILMAVEPNLVASNPPEGRFPKWKDVMQGFETVEGWSRLPKRCRPPDDCRVCNGTGEVFCQHCQRDGATCTTCYGEGFLPQTVEWLGGTVDRRNAWIITQIEGVEIARADYKLFFRAPGVMGCTMFKSELENVDA